MATLDATLAELKSITKALADHAIGTARSPAHSAHGALARLAPPDDFVPAQANAESYAAELVRHKGMLAQQRVGFVPPKADAAKPVAQEPQRTTGLTVAGTAEMSGCAGESLTSSFDEPLCEVEVGGQEGIVHVHVFDGAFPVLHFRERELRFLQRAHHARSSEPVVERQERPSVFLDEH